MKGVKSTLFLLVVLVGLVAYIYFVDRNQPLSDADEKENVFATATADQIEEIEIKSEKGDRSRLTRSGDDWTIVEPLQASADQGEISSIASSLADIDIQRVVDEKPADLKRFALDPPRLEVAYRVKGEKEMRRLHIGDKVPASEELFARVPSSPRVFLISGFLDSTFNKDTFALRDKRLLEFERDKAESIELTSGDTHLQLAKNGTEWNIVKPIAARGDFGAIQSILERLSSAQMQGVAAAEASEAELKKYGLDRPTATMVVGTGSSRATLTLGRTENALVFAKDAARPMVFTVAPTIKDDVFKPVADLRRKDLFDSRSFTADRVELKRGGDARVFEKSKGKDEKEIWRDAAGKDVDSMKMEELLSRLTGLRAASFETGTHASLQSPVLTATIAFDEKSAETVTFGRAGSDVFASRTGETGSAKLEGEAFDQVIKALDELK
jgi:hypothetical protein